MDHTLDLIKMKLERLNISNLHDLAISYTVSNLDKTRISRQIQSIELEIKEVEAKINE